MNQKVLVTGATRGIGKSICEVFANNSCEVLGIARNQKHLAWPIYQCDVSDTKALDSCFKSIVLEHGAPDVLINNAAMYLGQGTLEQQLSDYEVVMNTNVRSVFQLTQLFADALLYAKKPGCVVNISSVAARVGSIDPAYAASKGAINALTRSFARGLAGHGIRVNAISPGPVNTEMAERIPLERKAQYLQNILQNRFGEPSEIAEVAYFLASSKASLITGEILCATGGIL